MVLADREVKPAAFLKPWTKNTPVEHAPWRAVFALACGHDKDLICTKRMIDRIKEGIYQ